jgi:ATP-binding cassette subfamily B protein
MSPDGNPVRGARRRAAESVALLALLRHARPSLVAGLVLASLLVVVLPPLEALLTARIVAAVSAASPGTGLRAAGVLTPLVLLGVAVIVGHGMEAVAFSLRMAAGRRIDGAMRSAVRRAALAPGTLGHLEDAAFQDDAARLTRRGWNEPTLGTGAVELLDVAFRYLGAALSALILARFSGWLAVAALTVVIGLRAVNVDQWWRLAAIEDRHAGTRRRAAYWRDVTAGPDAAKELRVFGLRQWGAGHHRRLLTGVVDAVWHERRRVLTRQWPVFAVTVLAAGGVLGAPTLAALDGRVASGDLTAYLLAGWSLFALVQVGFEAYLVGAARQLLAPLDRLRGTEAAADGAARAATPLPAGDAPPAVAIENVSFGYPGGARNVVDGLSLRIEPGERLAIVGVNGAGKTTLIKLLSGLYQPTSGSIRVDGRDLRDVDVASWRRRLAVVFQDFVRYELPLRDNVAPAGLHTAADEEALLSCAADADLQAIADRLPRGWDTPLSRAYDGGADLSGGQWQRVAIARALFAVRTGARVLVLDEPTAHLDVRAELDFFTQVLERTAGASVVLISHRLSTVRQADRIVLLRDGAVAESGTHDELVAAGGEYARMFELQAARFAADRAGEALPPDPEFDLEGQVTR